MKTRPFFLRYLTKFCLVLFPVWAIFLSREGMGGENVLPECHQSTVKVIEDSLQRAPRRNSGRFKAAGDNERNALYQSIRALLKGEVVTALVWSHMASYQLCRERPDRKHNGVLWYPMSPTGEALVAVSFPFPTAGNSPRNTPNHSPKKLIIEVPHPFVDGGTAHQSLALFQELPAQALILSLTHRCAGLEKSGCTGRTSVCGRNEGFRISDPAHSPLTQFHVAHRALIDEWPDHLVLSVHGFVGEGISLSNGTTARTGQESAVASFHRALKKAFPHEKVTTCNRYPGSKNREIRLRLCGTSNVQGRYMAGSQNECRLGGDASSDHFLHLEQSRKLRQSCHWDKLIMALSALF